MNIQMTSQPNGSLFAGISLVADLLIAALKKNGIYDQMTSEQKNAYIPQFVEAAEERVGLELWGDLNPEAQEAYIVLISNPATTPVQISEFWHTHHTQFEERIGAVLQEYIEELLGAFHTTA